ncbi:hypothetical protein M5689_011919 [Euphorbia peplus]|nr:hypothetical protein M5689_011919 [Euphorbia peplus]
MVLMEQSALSEPEYEDSGELETTSYGCWCCWRPIKNGRYNQLGKEEEEKIEQGWTDEKLKKMKEFSEILAGPKWKNFIRRYGLNKKRRMQQLQYDPQSYALNFDDGTSKEIDFGFPNFSARFATFTGNKGDMVYESGLNGKETTFVINDVSMVH